jgi:phenylacetate-CoA ligase
MPLLRYDVGDVVEVEDPGAPCACGRAMPRIRRINGRQEDVILTPDGRAVTTLFIVFNQVAGVSLGQVVQEALDRLVVRIVRSQEYTEQSEAELLRYLRRFVGTEMRIEIEYLSAEAMCRQTVGKFRTIVSRIQHERTDMP